MGIVGNPTDISKQKIRTLSLVEMSADFNVAVGYICLLNIHLAIIYPVRDLFKIGFSLL